MTSTDRFPRPAWPEIWQQLEELPSDSERRESWIAQGHRWLSDTAAVLGPDFGVHDLGSFWIVSNRPAGDLKHVGKVLEQARMTILADLEGVASDPELSRLAILWLEDEGQYYEYISHFYPESGEFGMSGGMFLSGGYPHFVFPHYDESWQLARVIAHELTHALVSHLPLPLWLNEGLAVTLEEMVVTGHPPHPAPDSLKEHVKFWDEERIQEFWSGESFTRSDEGHGLSYALGQLLTSNFGHDYQRFRQFALAANWNDAGEAAAQQVLGVSLGDVLASFLGNGNWAPQPERWKGATHSTS